MKNIIINLASTTLFGLIYLSTISTALADTTTSTYHNSSISSAPIEIPTLTGEINIDGELKEKLWQNAAQIELKYETSPGENIPALVATQAKIFATTTSLYVAFIAHDPDSTHYSDKIRANISDRDNSWGDDQVGIKLDTFNDARLAYQFFVNPYGVQNDSIENELTGHESDAWDGIWYSSGKKTPQGYQVEMALPLRMFNFNNQLDIQTWGIELVRFYPRSKIHRLSSHPKDRNNACTLCQLGKATGLKEVTTGQNLQLTPALVINSNQQRELTPQTDWESEETVEPSLDIRWGITPNTLLSATINPDFSQVEADAGQLDINSTFALFYPEKRPFFLDNKDYFDTQVNLLHTRNIVSPDYGAKLTSKLGDHTVAFMAADDTQTNILIPGNLSSGIVTIDEPSLNMAGRYRYDYGQPLSIGMLMTAKTADQYHNFVASGDIKYQPNEQATFTGQYVYSNTLYPVDLYKNLCETDDCQPSTECELGDCGINEQVNRTKKEDEFSDHYYRLKYSHKTRNWFAFSQFESIGEDFRADLGFINKVDFQKFVTGGGYNWYPQNSNFSRVELSGDWDISYNQAGEMIERELEGRVEFEARMQSYTVLGLINRDRVGRRHDNSSLAIDDNTQLFNETLAWLHTELSPTRTMKLKLNANYGDQIDFSNDQLGTQLKLTPELDWKILDNLSIDISHTYRTMDVDSGRLFTANLTDSRINWHININNFIRLSAIYTHIERDPSLYQYSQPDALQEMLNNEVLYGYKLNPQSVFYLGYSNGLISDENIETLTRDEQTYFMKLSYAWII